MQPARSLMILLRGLLRCFLCIGMLLPSAVPAVTVVQNHGPVSEGVYSSLTVVEGRPAIAYTNNEHTAIKYLRAADDGGLTWGAPAALATGLNVGGPVSLWVVNGNPAVCYRDDEWETIRFVRASDATGGVWGTPLALETG